MFGQTPDIAEQAEKKRIELENKIKSKSKKCPYCNADMQFGYITSSWSIVWGEKIKALGFVSGNTERLTGLSASINHIPSFKCNNCGLVICQYK